MNPRNPFKTFIAVFTAAAFFITSVVWMPNGFAAAVPMPITVGHPEVSLPYQAKLGSSINFSIPSELGAIEYFKPGKGSTLIHIQDAHGHYEGQQKIRQLLGFLTRTYGINTVLVEGSAFRLDPEKIRFFPQDMKKTLAVNEAFTRHAWVAGAELYLLENPSAQALGIEEAESYRKNGRSFVDVLTQKQRTQQFLADMDMGIERLSSQYLNKDLRNFIKRQETFEKNQVPFEGWLTYLKGEAAKRLEMDLGQAKYQIDWPMMVRIFKIRELSQKLDKQVFAGERERFLKAIRRFLPVRSTEYGVRRKDGDMTRAAVRLTPYQSIESLLNSQSLSVQLPDPETSLLFEDMVRQLPKDFNYEAFPNVRYFIGCLLLQSELKALMLMDEVEKLTEKISAKLTQSQEEEKLVGLLKDHRLLQKLFALELLPADYDSILARKDGLKPSKIVEQLTGVEYGMEQGVRSTEYGDKNSAKRFAARRTQDAVPSTPYAFRRTKPVEFSHITELDQLFDAAMRFYAGVKERDGKMETRIEERLKETGAAKVAVITGGFHSQPMKEHFVNKGYSYALITPKISGADEVGHEDYVKAALASILPAQNTYKNPHVFSTTDHPGDGASLAGLKAPITGVLQGLTTNGVLTIPEAQQVTHMLAGRTTTGRRSEGEVRRKKSPATDASAGKRSGERSELRTERSEAPVRAEAREEISGLIENSDLSYRDQLSLSKLWAETHDVGRVLKSLSLMRRSPMARALVVGLVFSFSMTGVVLGAIFHEYPSPDLLSRVPYSFWLWMISWGALGTSFFSALGGAATALIFADYNTGIERLGQKIEKAEAGRQESRSEARDSALDQIAEIGSFKSAAGVEVRIILKQRERDNGWGISFQDEGEWEAGGIVWRGNKSEDEDNPQDDLKTLMLAEGDLLSQDMMSWYRVAEIDHVKQDPLVGGFLSADGHVLTIVLANRPFSMLWQQIKDEELKRGFDAVEKKINLASNVQGEIVLTQHEGQTFLRYISESQWEKEKSQVSSLKSAVSAAGRRSEAREILTTLKMEERWLGEGATDSAWIVRSPRDSHEMQILKDFLRATLLLRGESADKLDRIFESDKNVWLIFDRSGSLDMVLSEGNNDQTVSFFQEPFSLMSVKTWFSGKQPNVFLPKNHWEILKSFGEQDSVSRKEGSTGIVDMPLLKNGRVRSETRNSEQEGIPTIEVVGVGGDVWEVPDFSAYKLIRGKNGTIMNVQGYRVRKDLPGGSRTYRDTKITNSPRSVYTVLNQKIYTTLNQERDYAEVTDQILELEDWISALKKWQKGLPEDKQKAFKRTVTKIQKYALRGFTDEKVAAGFYLGKALKNFEEGRLKRAAFYLKKTADVLKYRLNSIAEKYEGKRREIDYLVDRIRLRETDAAMIKLGKLLKDAKPLLRMPRKKASEKKLREIFNAAVRKLEILYSVYYTSVVPDAKTQYASLRFHVLRLKKNFSRMTSPRSPADEKRILGNIREDIQSIEAMTGRSELREGKDEQSVQLFDEVKKEREFFRGLYTALAFGPLGGQSMDLIKFTLSGIASISGADQFVLEAEQSENPGIRNLAAVVKILIPSKEWNEDMLLASAAGLMNPAAVWRHHDEAAFYDEIDSHLDTSSRVEAQLVENGQDSVKGLQQQLADAVAALSRAHSADEKGTLEQQIDDLHKKIQTAKEMPLRSEVREFSDFREFSTALELAEYMGREGGPIALVAEKIKFLEPFQSSNLSKRLIEEGFFDPQVGDKNHALGELGKQKTREEASYFMGLQMYWAIARAPDISEAKRLADIVETLAYSRSETRVSDGQTIESLVAQANHNAAFLDKKYLVAKQFEQPMDSERVSEVSAVTSALLSLKGTFPLLMESAEGQETVQKIIPRLIDAVVEGDNAQIYGNAGSVLVQAGKLALPELEKARKTEKDPVLSRINWILNEIKHPVPLVAPPSSERSETRQQNLDGQVKKSKLLGAIAIASVLSAAASAQQIEISYPPMDPPYGASMTLSHTTNPIVPQDVWVTAFVYWKTSLVESTAIVTTKVFDAIFKTNDPSTTLYSVKPAVFSNASPVFFYGDKSETPIVSGGNAPSGETNISQGVQSNEQRILLERFESIQKTKVKALQRNRSKAPGKRSELRTEQEILEASLDARPLMAGVGMVPGDLTIEGIQRLKGERTADKVVPTDGLPDDFSQYLFGARVNQTPAEAFIPRPPVSGLWVRVAAMVSFVGLIGAGCVTNSVQGQQNFVPRSSSVEHPKTFNIPTPNPIVIPMGPRSEARTIEAVAEAIAARYSSKEIETVLEVVKKGENARVDQEFFFAHLERLRGILNEIDKVFLTGKNPDKIASVQSDVLTLAQKIRKETAGKTAQSVVIQVSGVQTPVVEIPVTVRAENRAVAYEKIRGQVSRLMETLRGEEWLVRADNYDRVLGELLKVKELLEAASVSDLSRELKTLPTNKKDPTESELNSQAEAFKAVAGAIAAAVQTALNEYRKENAPQLVYFEPMLSQFFPSPQTPSGKIRAGQPKDALKQFWIVSYIQDWRIAAWVSKVFPASRTIKTTLFERGQYVLTTSEKEFISSVMLQLTSNNPELRNAVRADVLLSGSRISFGAASISVGLPSISEIAQDQDAAFLAAYEFSVNLYRAIREELDGNYDQVIKRPNEEALRSLSDLLPLLTGISYETEPRSELRLHASSVRQDVGAVSGQWTRGEASSKLSKIAASFSYGETSLAETVTIVRELDLYERVTQKLRFGIVALYLKGKLQIVKAWGLRAFGQIAGVPLATAAEPGLSAQNTVTLASKPETLNLSRINAARAVFGETALNKTSDVFIIGATFAFDRWAIVAMRAVFGNAPMVVLVRNDEDRAKLAKVNSELPEEDQIFDADNIREVEAFMAEEKVRQRGIGRELRFKAIVDASDPMAIALKEMVPDFIPVNDQNFKSFMFQAGDVIQRIVADFQRNFALGKSA